MDIWSDESLQLVVVNLLISINVQEIIEIVSKAEVCVTKVPVQMQILEKPMNVFTNNLAFVLHVDEMEALSHRLELSCHLFADQVSQLLQFCSSPSILDDEGSLLKTQN